MTVGQLATREGVQPAYVTRVLRLAFLSPKVVEAVLSGTVRPEVSVGSLTLTGTVAAQWDEQAELMLAAQQAPPLKTRSLIGGGQ